MKFEQRFRNSCVYEYSQWHCHEEFDYYTGVTYTKKGIIELYWQDDLARAWVVYKKRQYYMVIEGGITRLGFIRKVNKWLRSL